MDIKDRIKKNKKHLLTETLIWGGVGLFGGLLTSILDGHFLIYILGMPIMIEIINVVTNFDIIKENSNLKRILKKQQNEENATNDKEITPKLEQEIEKSKEINNNPQKETINFLKTMFDGEPKNINPLIDLPLPQMKLYGISGVFSSVYFDTLEELNEYLNTIDVSMVNVCTIEYLGNVAGRNDVIKYTSKNGKSTLYTAVDEDGYGVYNYERSFYRGEYVWEYNHGNLKTMYSAFRDRGIEFENDIYAEISERNKQLIKMCKEKGYFQGNNI